MRIPPPVVVPLALLSVLAAALGFMVTRELAPQGADDAPKVSVVGVPATPPPVVTSEPTLEPSDPTPPAREGRSGRGGRTDLCPAGCTCESRPPSGVRIVCRGARISR